MIIEKQIDLMERLTEVYKNNLGEHKTTAEAAFLAVMLPEVMLDYDGKSWFIGDYFELPIGHSAQVRGQGLGYYCLPRVFEYYLSDSSISDNNKVRLKNLLEFWLSHDTKSKIEKRAGIKLRSVINMTNIDYGENHNEVVLPLYRLAGTQLDYELLLTTGLPGMRNLIISKVYDRTLCDAMLSVVDTMFAIIERYIKALEAVQSDTSYDSRKFNIILTALKTIKAGKPETFHQAIQLIWLYAQCAGCYNYGRLDDYLAPYYEADINAGRITEAEALEYIVDFYDRLSTRCSVTDGRFTVGGVGRKYPAAADRLALQMMEAVRIRHTVLPQLTLRFYSGQNPALMKKALELISEGTTYPLLYNDDVNINAVGTAFGIGHNEAEQYLPYSCGEYIINHKSIGTPSATINVLKALEVTIFGGRELIADRQMGTATGGLESFETFNEFLVAYKKQLTLYIDACAEFQMLEYTVASDSNAFLLISMLSDDCLDRSQTVLGGGIRYLCGALECYGNTNAADSLAAIKRLVYDEAKISRSELCEMLKNNYSGYEMQRMQLLDIPKYGNDDDYADSFMHDLHEFLCGKISDAGRRVGMHAFLAVLINNSFNSIFGLITAASADGRLSGTYMANANNPTGGMDKSGITAMLNSLLKLRPDIHAGYVQNIKLSTNMFTEFPENARALLDTYFSQGGTQAMITVLNKNDLEDAMTNPQNHLNLLVRVGGFTAKFIELPLFVQKEIASRTLY